MRTDVLEFVARGKIGFADLGEPPTPGPTEVLVETRYTGVTNGTERHALLTEHGFGGGRFPSRHGYQHVGQVAAVGEKVDRFKPGDWAFFGPCVGHRAWNVSEQDGLIIKLPEGVEHKFCALFGVAGVALRAVRRMGVADGQNVWVVGQGPIGQFAAQTARAAGAQVTVTDVVENRLDVARQCGIPVVLDARDDTAWNKLGEGGPYDFIFDCCSLEGLFFDIRGRGLLAHGGTIGALAVRDRVKYPWSLLHGTEARIETSCHFRPDDLAALVELYERGEIQTRPLVTHQAPIADAPAIYRQLASKSDGLLGIIFDWSV